MITLDAAQPHRILIIRLSALGDVVYTLPALAALRRHLPQAYIAWAVEEAAAGILAGHPELDDVIVVPRKRWMKRIRRAEIISVTREMLAVRKRVRKQNFDIAIDFQGNLRGALAAAASGAKIRVGFAPPDAKEQSHRLLNCTILIPAGLPVHRIERNLILMRALGVPASEYRGTIPAATDGQRQRVSQFLDSANISGSFALVHPGVSSFGSFKQWPVERYVELITRLKEEGIQTVLSAGPGEEKLVSEIKNGAGKAPAAEGLELPELAELMRRAAVFVGSDTGPTQMAWMLGTPTVALMGPKDPRVYGPLGETHRKISADLECAPCARRSCANNRCMKEIAAGEVLHAAISIMRK